jgi:hypothetical protein
MALVEIATSYLALHAHGYMVSKRMATWTQVARQFRGLMVSRSTYAVGLLRG